MVILPPSNQTIPKWLLTAPQKMNADDGDFDDDDHAAEEEDVDNYNDLH